MNWSIVCMDKRNGGLSIKSCSFLIRLFLVLKIHNSKQIPLELGDYRKVWGGRVGMVL